MSRLAQLTARAETTKQGRGGQQHPIKVGQDDIELVPDQLLEKVEAALAQTGAEKEPELVIPPTRPGD
jgi:hypothetical protein